MTRRLWVFIVLSIIGLNCSVSKSFTSTNTINASALQPFGRTVINDQQQLELISSASHAGFSFDGNECIINAAVPSWLHHNYLQYELDGVYQKRLRVSSKTGEALVIKAPSSGRHTVWLYKATEAHTGAVLLRSISGNNLVVLRRPSLPLVEFIGNSITCGAAADPSEVPCGTGVYHDQHNAYLAYGPRVARAIGANFLLSSVSGIGVYRNWNSDGPAMPQVYQKTDFQDKTATVWNFSKYEPSIVSIALGTNDFSRGDGKQARLPFDSVRFVNAYVDFVKQVKQLYPSAQIALLSSPMISGDARILLQNCLTTVKTSIDQQYPSPKTIALFFFQPMQARGCTGHPNVEDHGIMAEQLIPFFRNLLR